MEDSKPWERLEGEPAQWYARFERFRLAGPSRTMEAAWRQEAASSKAKRPHSRWYAAAARWNWKERVNAWDDAEREKVRESQAEAIHEMNKRHVQEARALQGKAIARLQAMDAKELSPESTLRYFVEAVRLERSALGEPESRVEIGWRDIAKKQGIDPDDLLNTVRSLIAATSDH